MRPALKRRLPNSASRHPYNVREREFGKSALVDTAVPYASPLKCPAHPSIKLRDRAYGLSKYVTIVVEVSEGKPPFQIERGAEKTLTRESSYVFHADAEPGRSFAEQLQAEINRCRSR